MINLYREFNLYRITLQPYIMENNRKINFKIDKIFLKLFNNLYKIIYESRRIIKHNIKNNNYKHKFFNYLN